MNVFRLKNSQKKMAGKDPTNPLPHLPLTELILLYIIMRFVNQLLTSSFLNELISRNFFAKSWFYFQLWQQSHVKKVGSSLKWPPLRTVTDNSQLETADTHYTKKSSIYLCPMIPIWADLLETRFWSLLVPMQVERAFIWNKLESLAIWLI